ncbi:hypothetical protein MXB_5507, partial [Myxobolus squamalis]
MMKQLQIDERKQKFETDTPRRECQAVSQRAQVPGPELACPGPEPKKIKISKALSHVGERVALYAWVSSIRRQSKSLMFIDLRDGTGYLQTIFCDALCQTSDAISLSPESTICVYGVISRLPDGKIAPGQIELTCDYWRLLSRAPSGGIDAVLNSESNPDTQLNFRHLQLRTEEFSSIMRVRSRVMDAFRAHYASFDYIE